VTVLDVVRQAATVALIVAAVLAGAGLSAFYALPVPVGVALVALTVPLVRGLGPLRPSFDTARWTALLKMIAPYAAATAVGSIYVYVAAVLLSLVSSAHEVGIFSASFRVFVVVAGIALLLVGAAFPIVARAARDDARRLGYATQRLFETTLLAGAWIGLLTVLCAPTAIDVIAGGGAFSESVHVLRIQGAAVLFSFLAVTAGHVLVSLHRSRALVAGACAGLAVSAAVTLSLAHSLGAGAGAWANVAGEGVIAAVNIVALTSGPQAIRLHFGVAWKVALATGAAATLVLAGLPNVVLGVAATLVFFAIALALHAVPRELLDAIPRRRR
jgi:O-antigen/teichoic acid export membrane protein